MSALLGELLSGTIWSKITPYIIILAGFLFLTTGYYYISNKSLKAEIINLQTEIELCRANLKGAEDAAFSINKQYEILKSYMHQLGKNIINMSGEIDEKEFSSLLSEIKKGGKKK